MLPMAACACGTSYSLSNGDCSVMLRVKVLSKALTLTCCMRSSGTQGEGGVLAVAFESPDRILLARGLAVKPVFERVKVPTGGSSKAAQIQLPSITVRPCPFCVPDSPDAVLCLF